MVRSPTVTLPGPGRGLEPRGDVHGVADDRVAVADRAGEHLARVHAHAQREVDAVGEARVDLRHRVLHAEPGAHGALGVVLVRDRRAEDRHHVVADVLVDRAAVALDLLRRGGAARGRRATSPPPGPSARRTPCSRTGRRTGRSPGGAPRAGRPGADRRGGRSRRGVASSAVAAAHAEARLGGAGVPQLGQRRSSARAAGHAEARPGRILGSAGRAVHRAESYGHAQDDRHIRGSSRVPIGAATPPAASSSTSVSRARRPRSPRRARAGTRTRAACGSRSSPGRTTPQLLELLAATRSGPRPAACAAAPRRRARRRITPLEQLVQVLLAVHVERQRGGGVRVDREALDLDDVARVEVARRRSGTTRPTRSGPRAPRRCSRPRRASRAAAPGGS